jgi:citrate lyase beta subunit
MDGLYVVTIDALPLPGTEAADSYGGAYISVYTTDESEAAAVSTASREVAEAGWQSRDIQSVTFVTREDFEDGSDDLAYFEQAQIDGVVLVMHTFPNEAEDADARH